MPRAAAEQQMEGALTSGSGTQSSYKENPLHSLRTPGEVVRRHYYARPEGETNCVYSVATARLKDHNCCVEMVVNEKERIINVSTPRPDGRSYVRRQARWT